jgi:hypothetical protein
VGVDGPGRTKSVSESGSAAAIWSVAQAFATFNRNALYFNFELKMAQFISHKATFFVHFIVFLGRE